MSTSDDRSSVSRRRFLKDSVTGAAGAAATAAIGGGAVTAAAQSGSPAGAATPGIKVPAEFAALASTKGKDYAFPMTGAQVFARACKEEGVAALFCCPGNYTVIHAIASAGIPAFGGRHEGSMAHAADAFIRVTGEIAVALGHRGPGLHQHDLRDRLRQRRAHAAAGRWPATWRCARKTPRPAFSSATSSRRPKG